MKKIFLALVLTGFVAVIMISCGPSKRGYGCPAAEGIVH
jgi:hypothetical protein